MAKEEANYQQQLLEHIIEKSNLQEYFFLILSPNLASAALGLHVFTAICCFLILIITLRRRNVSNSSRRDRRGSGTEPDTDPESGLGPGLGPGLGTGIGDIIGPGGHVMEVISRIANAIQLGSNRTEEDTNNNSGSVDYDSIPVSDESPRAPGPSGSANRGEYSQAQGAVRRANKSFVEAIRNARGRGRARGDTIRPTNPLPPYPGTRGTTLPYGFDAIRSSTLTTGYEAPLPAGSNGAGGVEPDRASTSLPNSTREGPNAIASLP